MAGSRTSLPEMPIDAARTLLLHRQGLLRDPARKASPAGVYQLIEQLGYVQVDTISVVARAHEHIIHTRLEEFHPRMLRKLLEKDRRLFEHWTHDASIIPACWYAYWKPRFERFRQRWQTHAWWRDRLGGDPEALFDHVCERIEREGPLLSRDFEHTYEKDEDRTWWGWKPQKAALDLCWRMGRLAITGRAEFQKIYDLPHRVFGDAHAQDAPTHDAYIDWSCRFAMDRLGVATPAEIAGYLNHVTNPEATAWCRQRIQDGELVEVTISPQNHDARPWRSYAVHDWKKRFSRAKAAPDCMRLLSPFDPIIRDRKRALRVLNFDYRFEAFTPAAKRTYGYYVLPILDGDRLVGRLDPKMHRDRGTLEIKGVWWEPGVRNTRKHRARLDDALDRYAHLLAADTIEFTS